ncbi:pro-resilin-like [Leptidea sinapis]|uniref:pro-resilin-like n=1 Tax=Leptidea sinapis TaxID=189913 RepID=UPI0021318159|nr:pro-resilin-like [Leptidea sinapis]
MKLVIFLSVIACGYGDKLDRTYLPPASAATAGGSPGSLTAPGSPGFNQNLQGQSAFGPISSGIDSSRTPGFGSASAAFNGQAELPAINQPSSTRYTQPSGLASNPSGSINAGLNNLPSTQFGDTGLNKLNGPVQAPASNGFGSGTIGQQLSSAYSQPQQGSTQSFGTTPGFGSSSIGTQSSQFTQQPGNIQAFGQSASLAPQSFQPERAQAAADRNAEILRYDNEIDGDRFAYSFETSNGISAEESGVAAGGVKAQGQFSYTGDDGNAYSITYTADENGYRPQGNHLPTSPPIPEEILKSIEINAQAAAAGTQEGAYRPEEYESDGGLQGTYNTGAPTYNQQLQANGDGSNPNLSAANDRPLIQNIGQGNNYQSRPEINNSQNGLQVQSGEYNLPSGNKATTNEQGVDYTQGQRDINLGLGLQRKGQQSSGYQYNSPNNGVSRPNRPQAQSALAQSQPQFGSNSLSGSFQGPTGQQPISSTNGFSSNRVNTPSPSNYQPDNLSSGFDSSKLSPENLSNSVNAPNGGYNYERGSSNYQISSGRPNSQQQNSFNRIQSQPSFSGSQNQQGSANQVKPSSQYQPSSANQAKPSPQYQPNSANQVAPGSQYQLSTANQITPSSLYQPSSTNQVTPNSQYQPTSTNQITSGSQYQPSSANQISSGSQYQPGLSVQLQSSSPNRGQSGLQQGSQYQTNPNQGQFRPSSQGQATTSGIGQNGASANVSPYQYNRPTQGLPQGQGQQQTPINQLKNPDQNQARPEFGGPRQPPSFNSEEGYKY